MPALVVSGVIFASIMAAMSRFLAAKQGNAETYPGFLIIAPSIVLVCVISGFRGWFQGEMYMLPTALSNVVEQAVKLSVGLGVSFALAKRGVLYAVCGALFGVTASEVATVIYMLATYLVRLKKKGKEKFCHV